MKEFMLLIKNKIDHQKEWTKEHHQNFLKKCETYIGELKASRSLISAQPLVKEGIIISGKSDAWTESPLTEDGEVQVGYYHILAKDLTDAIAIAKRNPEFEFSTTARVEVRPIKTREETTGFNYPQK